MQHVVATCNTLLRRATRCCDVQHVVATCNTLLRRATYCCDVQQESQISCTRRNTSLLKYVMYYICWYARCCVTWNVFGFPAHVATRHCWNAYCIVCVGTHVVVWRKIYLTFLHTSQRVTFYMGWLRWVGSLKLQVSFAEYHLFYRALLQKRPIILRSLLIVATLYVFGFPIWLSYLALGWLRLVVSFKWYVSFAKEPYKRDEYSAKET